MSKLKHALSNLWEREILKSMLQDAKKNCFVMGKKIKFYQAKVSAFNGIGNQDLLQGLATLTTAYGIEKEWVEYLEKELQ